MQETMPIRPGFWNVPLWAEIGVYVIGIAAVILCIAGIIRAVKNRKLGKMAEETLPNQNDKRIARLMREVFAQERVIQGASGKAHFAVFWGFIFLFFGTAIATLDWDVGHLIFDTQFLKGWVYLTYKLVLDIAGLAALTALAWYAYRRFVAHDPKVEPDSRFKLILGSLAGIIVTGFLVEALRLAVQQPAWSAFSPVGNAIAMILFGFDAETLRSAHVFMWVIHGLAALTFVAAIPLTYYAHLFKTPTSIFWQKLEAPVGAVKKIEDIEEQESFGISSFEQFSWRDRIRLDGCTECGRCRSVCPAVKAGDPLDPKNVVLKLQARMRGENADKDLIGGIIDPEELWSCTTCGACANVCPARIPLPDMIVSMRRHLAMEQGEFPEGLQGAVENTMNVGNPWGMDPGSRLDWAEGLDVPVAEEGEEVEVLYWVGCSASYDRRAQKIARSMVEIFKAAGVKFAVMEEERCHGEFARRAGEEYLFQMAAQENIENFQRFTFKKIVAACPHCFNTLKNEYPQFEGGKFEVVSHAEFIADLIRAGKLPLAKGDEIVTLHDACYLARYNGDTQNPRDILAGVAKSVVEPAKSGCDATCCGAGGAQIFMDRPARINVIRLKEIKETGAQKIAVTCPHCLTMLASAQAQENNEATAVAIQDIAEIVAAKLVKTEA